MTDRGVKVSYSAVSNYGDHLVLWLTQQKKKKIKSNHPRFILAATKKSKDNTERMAILHIFSI